MNSSLEKLVKNLSDNDFKHLTQEFGSKNLESLKQKAAYPYEYVNSFNGKKLDGHISDKDYFTCKKIWNKFNLKNVLHYKNLQLYFFFRNQTDDNS